MTDPTPLSPAAQAMLDATAAVGLGEFSSRAAAVAALRAAALHCKRDRLQLLAIADELEGSHTSEND